MVAAISELRQRASFVHLGDAATKNYRILHRFGIAVAAPWGLAPGALYSMKSTHDFPLRSTVLASFLAAFLFLPGCKTPEKKDPEPEEVAPVVAQQRKELIGKPLAEALTLYGPQIVDDRTYTVSQLPNGVFYLPIRRRFPLSNPALQKTLIREVHWDRQRVRMAVFCQRVNGVWVIFENTEWTPGAGF